MYLLKYAMYQYNVKHYDISCVSYRGPLVCSLIINHYDESLSLNWTNDLVKISKYLLKCI